MKSSLRILAMLTLVSLWACGPGPASGPSGLESGTPRARAARRPTVRRVGLPDGWTIDQAIPLANLEFIMGKKGYSFLIDPASNAEEDHPIGSFVLPDLPNSQIRFEVLADGRRVDYDAALAELNRRIDFPGRLWEAAALGEVVQEGRTRVRLVGLRGSVCFNVTWDPAAYPDMDRTMVSLKLAELLLNGMYSRHEVPG